MTPPRAQVLINMGHLYDKLGDPERARQCFEAAAKLAANE